MRRLVLLLIAVVVTVLGAYLFVRAVLASDLVRSTLEQQLATRLNQPVRIRAATAALFPRLAIDLHDVSIGAPPSVQFDRIRVVTGLGGLLSRVVTDAEIRIDGGRVTLPLSFSLAPPAAQAAPQAPSSGAITVTSVHLIAVRDVALASGKQSVSVDLDSSLDGDRLDVRRLSARAQRSRIEATGAVTSLSKLEAEFDATADPFDLDEIIMVGAALGGGGDSGTSRPAAPMRLTVKLAAPEARFSTYVFRELSTTMAVVAGRVTFAPLSLRTLGGGFDGRLDADTEPALPHLRLNGRIENLDVAEAIKATGSPGGITGRLTGSLALAGAGADAVMLMENSRGTMTAAITNGSMPRLDMVRTIVLAFGKPSGAPEGSGSAFSRLGGSFSLAAGVVSSDNLTMDSRDFDMSGRGSFRLSTGAVDARADVVLSEELTSQAGTDLRRYAQQDGRVIIPATITGTLHQPKVSLDVAAAMQRAVGSELKRRATTFLEGLFKKKK